MPILNRLSSLFFADIHAVLDKLEDPHISLTMSIREMEAALAETSQEITAHNSEREKLERKRSQILEQLSNFDEELNVCFESDEEALAKTVLRKKLACENALEKTRKNIGEIEQRLEAQQALFQENERQLLSMKEKLALFDSEIDANNQNLTTTQCSYEAVSDEAVEVAFLREKQRRKSS